MKNLFKNRVSVADSMVLIGIGLAASYWVLESLFNIFTTQDINFFNQLLGPDINEVWPRIIVFCLFIFFGSHVQYTINNRKKAEQALKISEEKYRSILQSIEEGYYEVDLAGNLTFFNESVAKMLGYSPDRLMGMNNREFSTPETAKETYRVFNSVFKTGKPADLTEFEAVDKSGDVRILELSVSLRRTSKGDPMGFRGVVRDVTQRLKAEREKQRLAAQLQEARAATILGLAKLAEYRDEGTGSHLERIREYARLIAVQMARLPKYDGYITKEYTEDLFRSSILHDIGKVGIPDAILLKPDGLTPEEFEVIKTHTLIGGEALNAIDSQIEGKSFLTLGKEIAYHHHEKWDGSGYPRGLKGERIPLSARMVALADVYDALTTKRFYKEAYSHQKAKDIIISLRGTHFDPDVVDSFLACEDIFEKISLELKEENAVAEEPTKINMN
jgi:PAS domain S-box-containing protein